jgi:hypothetical protein
MFTKSFWKGKSEDWFLVERRGLKWYPQLSTDLGTLWIPIGRGFWFKWSAIDRCKQVDEEMVKHGRKIGP